MRTPESDNGSRKEDALKRELPDNVGSHLVIGILFSAWLVTSPRDALRVLKTHGIRGSYGMFYTNIRPSISYPPSKPK